MSGRAEKYIYLEGDSVGSDMYDAREAFAIRTSVLRIVCITYVTKMRQSGHWDTCCLL